ncbi:MAG: hypothetical protein JWL81_3253, partial [Verrucomicrobiales bacterium]|nr:hypothetical protein [Verrucomicrobiales bacterium]
AVLLTQCAAVPEDEGTGEPKLEKMEHAKLEPGPEDADGKPLDIEKPDAGESTTPGLAPVSGKEGRFVIRDNKGAMRVEGVLKGGRMDGLWKYFDPTGRRLAEVTYRADQRQGPATLYYVARDGKAAGRKRMTAVYEEGALNGFARNWSAGGGKSLEREFDRGILESARGWDESGKELSDSAAQTVAIETCRNEDALLAELEAFVQLKIRQHATDKP